MKEPVVNVGILSGNEIKFELYGDFNSFGFDENFSGRYTAKIEDDTIVIDNGQKIYRSTNEIIFIPSDISSESFLIRDVIIGINFHWQQKENQRFVGSLKLIKDADKITVVNSIPLELYLTSVISSEMSASSSLELLKAHAVISRSWLLAQLSRTRINIEQSEDEINVFKNENEFIKWYDRGSHSNFDVCADDHCQRYQGITKVYNDAVRKAINITRGVVLLYQEKICDTRYSKSCGGISESFENVWEAVQHPYLTSIIDYKYVPDNFNLDFSNEKNADKWILSEPQAFCNTKDAKILSQVLQDYDQKTKDFYRWQIEYSQKEISELINKKSGIDFGEILDLIPVERGNSSRIIKLKIIGTKKTMIVGKELEIRRILSNTHLYSSAVIFTKQNIENGIPQKFIIKGAGWGHGVGLCQIGAAVMAEIGYKFDEILSHYFKGAKLKKIY